ncbi:hypothetical protein H7U05_24240 [Priestia megaterium]|uniref:hypothetical protein n=1 Tax=Priestia megaterium TaxID=1404 RepID=UPI001C8EB598|nr:hypothetical protein [Priestia megaterium]MBY0200363.1 hypothetical protein [Priestia megaterium]
MKQGIYYKNSSSNNEKKTTGMISEISSIPFLFFLTLPMDTAFPFLKTGGDFLGIEQENFFISRTFLNNHSVII